MYVVQYFNKSGCKFFLCLGLKFIVASLNKISSYSNLIHEIIIGRGWYFISVSEAMPVQDLDPPANTNLRSIIYNTY